MKESVQATLTVIGILAFITFVVWASFTAPCEVYATTPQKDVPARCMSTFKGAE